MLKRSFYLIASAAALMVGCATGPKELVNTPSPTCFSEADCQAKWDAAQLFVVKNSGMKIQTATNVLIETYNPAQYSTDIAMQVTKEPLGSGRYKIVARAFCRNMFGCTPSAASVVNRFNSEVARVAQ